MAGGEQCRLVPQAEFETKAILQITITVLFYTGEVIYCIIFLIPQQVFIEKPAQHALFLQGWCVCVFIFFTTHLFKMKTLLNVTPFCRILYAIRYYRPLTFLLLVYLFGISESVAQNVAPSTNPDFRSTGSTSFNSNIRPVSYDHAYAEAKNNDWLNGVTTYDLVLISKHICGLELLDSPYKIIAADANQSGSVTSTDVVDFRKLILGITTSLPNGNTSWRYINADHVFPNPTNPFQTPFPENWEGVPPASDIDFIAVKIGDVNNSHTPDDIIGMPRPAVQPVGIGKPSQRAGEYVTIPVSYEGSEAIAAIQLGLRFDADDWELLEPSTADLPDYEPGCFNLRDAAEGRIKFLWFTPWPKEQLQQGRTLFYLTFRNKKGDTEAMPMLYTDDSILESMGFSASGQTYTLAVKELPAARSAASADAALNWSVDCAPNPVADAATLRIESPLSQPMSVWVFNALGVRTYYREMVVQAGTTQVTIPEVAGWPAGIYTWKVKAGKEKRQGQFVHR